MSVATRQPLDQQRRDRPSKLGAAARPADASEPVARSADLGLRVRLTIVAALPLVFAVAGAVLSVAVGSVALPTWLVVVLAGSVGLAVAAFAIRRWVRSLDDVAAYARQVSGLDSGDPGRASADDPVGVISAAVERLVVDLDASRQELGVRAPARTRLLEQLINAQEEERKRIARELHDGVGQALLSLMVGLKLIADIDSLDAANEKAEDLRSVVAESLEQVRTLSRELRPSVLDDLGLAVALDRYTTEFSGRHPSIAVDLHCDQTDRVPSVVETALYRIVQEAMTNAARHGSCSTIGVLLTRRDETVQAIIEDDGQGFDVEAARRAGRSVGLHGMAERAEFVGGKLDIESSGEGTTVFVEVPV